MTCFLQLPQAPLWLLPFLVFISTPLKEKHGVMISLDFVLKYLSSQFDKFSSTWRHTESVPLCA